MYSRFKLVTKYIAYYLRASNGRGHGVHSPFVYRFITKVKNDTTTYPEYAQVESLRDRKKKDHTLLEVEDMGAGSGSTASSQRTIASVIKSAAKPTRLGQLLFRMVREYQPDRMLELGTSLGITSAYLAMGNLRGKLYTLEGASAIAAEATKHFQALQLTNISQTLGNFDQELAPVLAKMKRVDFAFLDGNHRQEPTERYFREILPYRHNDTILVLDDIHWSREMELAWETIRQHPDVRCTIDLFFIGIVLFREEFREKQHFTIRL